MAGADSSGPAGPWLSHVDESGAAHMVDVTGKDATKRTAVAAGTLRTRADVVELIATGGLPKGDALATARVAGILAAKRTSDLIPLCHQLALTGEARLRGHEWKFVGTTAEISAGLSWRFPSF